MGFWFRIKKTVISVPYLLYFCRLHKFIFFQRKAKKLPLLGGIKTKWNFFRVDFWTGVGVSFHSLLVTRCKITRNSLQLLVAKIPSLLVAEIARCSQSLDTRCKIRFLLVPEVARSRKPFVTRCKIRLLLVLEVAYCKKSLVASCKIRSLLVVEVARCKICSLLVAEVACCKKSLVAKNHSLLVAKFNRYLLHKITKKT